MRKQFLVTVLSLLVFISTAIANDTTEQKITTIIPIKEAIEKGLVKVKVIGAYNTYFIYEALYLGDGLHYGKCMAIELESNYKSTIQLKLEAGTLLIPKQDSVQTMLVTNDIVFPLYPKEKYWSRFYAMCTQIYYHPPSTAKEFNIGGMADTNLVKLAKYIQSNYCQNMIAQHAVWAYTDKVNFDTLKKYGADTISVKRTIEILNAVNIVTPLNKTFTKPGLKQNPAPTMTLNSYIVYGGVGLIGLLSLTTITALIRRKKNKEMTA